MVTCLKTFVLTALVLIASALAQADDANWIYVGSAGSFKPNPDVEMVKEHVQIALDNKEMHVKATFWFKNHGRDQMVTMAFPDETSNNHRYIAEQKFSHAIKDFKSWVDSQPVEVKRERVKTDDEFNINSVWTKRVDFKEGQSRRVDVEYAATHGFAGSAWAVDVYALKTGATWRGSIGSCRIDVDWSKATQLSAPVLDFGPKVKKPWTRTSPKSATITLTNIEPDFDLDLTMIQGFWNFTMNGRLLPQNLGLPDHVTGSTVKGDPKDILLSIHRMGYFFGDDIDGDSRDWVSPEAKAFGSSLEFKDKRTLQTGTGKRIKLRRPVQGSLPDDQKGKAGYVYLKDLIEALGGTYKYNAKLDQINLTLPKK